jgi:aminomethyltransferase
VFHLPDWVFLSCTIVRTTIVLSKKILIDAQWHVHCSAPELIMVKQSALLDLYRARGATLIERDSWLLPAHFGDPVAEYQAVRNHVGVLDLCQRTFLRFTGADQIGLLNDSVSNDLNALAPGQGLHAAFLNLNGKILADARIFRSTDFFLVDLPEARKETILWDLRLRRPACNIEITDLVADCTMLSVQGPRAEQLVAEVAPTNGLSSLDLSHRQVTIAGGNVTLIVVTHGAQLGYDLIIPMTGLLDVVSLIEEAGKRRSLSWVGFEAQEMLRVEAGIPLYGVDITEENSLLQTSQDRWISFKTRLAGLVLQSKQTVQSGAKIYDGDREIGRITSCMFSPHNNSAVALGYIRGDCATPSKRVTIQDGEKPLAATVSLLPIS